MRVVSRRTWGPVAGLLLLAACQSGGPLDTSSGEEKRAALEIQSQEALNMLYEDVPAAQDLANTASGILVFPEVVKAGLGVGGETGNGVLYTGGVVDGYYNKSGASFGFQAGAQKRAEIIMFLSDEALGSLKTREGFEFGVDASAAVLDVGAGGTLDTNNIDSEVVAFILDQSGLMASASLEGSKVTEIDLDS